MQIVVLRKKPILKDAVVGKKRPFAEFHISSGSLINKKIAYSVFFGPFATLGRHYIQKRLGKIFTYRFLHIFAMSKTLLNK